jgi:hypothetical protein
MERLAEIARAGSESLVALEAQIPEAGVRLARAFGAGLRALKPLIEQCEQQVAPGELESLDLFGQLNPTKKAITAQYEGLELEGILQHVDAEDRALYSRFQEQHERLYHLGGVGHAVAALPSAVHQADCFLRALRLIERGANNAQPPNCDAMISEARRLTSSVAYYLDRCRRLPNPETSDLARTAVKIWEGYLLELERLSDKCWRHWTRTSIMYEIGCLN